MPHRILMLATSAVVIAVTIGAGARAAQSPCALLTADDVAAVMGGRVTQVSTAGTPVASTQCSYSVGDQGVELMLWGGRAEFDNLIGQLGAGGLTPLSGVGDKAYENLHTGSGVDVYVIERGTSFQITLQNGTGVASSSDPAAESAVKLARKVANRIKSK